MMVKRLLPLLGTPDEVLGWTTGIGVDVGARVGLIVGVGVGTWVETGVGVTVLAEDEAENEVFDSAARTMNFLVIALLFSSVMVMVCSPGVRS